LLEELVSVYHAIAWLKMLIKREGISIFKNLENL